MTLIETLESREALFSQDLDKALKKLGKTRADLANEIGITPQGVDSWIRIAKRIPKKRQKEVIKVLLKWKGVTFPDEEKIEDPLDENKRVVHNTLSKLTIKDKEALKNALKVNEDKSQKVKEKSSIRIRREKIGVTQRFIASVLSMNASTYSLKESETTFTDEQKVMINKTLTILENMKERQYLTVDKGNKDESFFKKMHEAIETMSSLIKEEDNLTSRLILTCLNEIKLIQGEYEDYLG